ncbi:GntR family transcriptional regulator [Geodermatophilus sp. YIM 151500]|uniref:GntR family transcriptional regulator n=1 Tax=Geodermatophilus sp. YIM 151500 TaxID=2984531 RepID=UPI0021E49918|nr:GntR family transcriptional regulator [Geodermatophilus sp. YIM 151500]MCV2488196.1 GntR family transcriptional regulator [Geodermatophilus sp. YIM 151500]
MSSLEPLDVERVSSRVFEALERAIVECRIEPGAALSDRQLAEELRVSRTPVRDALRQLESTGLVERRGRVGWSVTRVEVRDVEELFDLRCLLEPAGVPRIASWDDDRLRRFVTLFDDFSTPMGTDDIARYLRVDDEFHATIVGAAENRRLAHAYRLLSRELSRFRHFTSYRYEGRVDQSLGEHRAICGALARRDVPGATDALVAHILSARDTLVATVHASAAPADLRTTDPEESA